MTFQDGPTSLFLAFDAMSIMCWGSDNVT